MPIPLSSIKSCSQGVGGRGHASHPRTGDQSWIEPGDSLGKFPHVIAGKTGPERRDLPKVIQKVGGRAKTEPLSEKMSQSFPLHFSGYVWLLFSMAHLLFSKYLLNSCYVPDNVLGPKNAAANKTDKTATLVKFIFKLNYITHLLYFRGCI